MRTLILSIAIVIITNNLIFAQQNDLFQEILDNYIILKSRVDYDSLAKEERLTKYLSSFEEVNLSELNNDEKKALFINAYNAGTLKIGADHYPSSDIDKIYDGNLLLGRLLKRSAWNIQKVNINGNNMSLSEIKKQLIVMNDPRIAFLLYQPYLEGPNIIDEPITESNIETYLEKRSEEFWNYNLKNVYEFGIKSLRISGIAERHRGFFPSREAIFIEYIIEKLDPGLMAGYESYYLNYGGRKNIKEAILQDVRLNPKAWEIVFKPYESTMNGVD